MTRAKGLTEDVQVKRNAAAAAVAGCAFDLAVYGAVMYFLFSCARQPASYMLNNGHIRYFFFHRYHTKHYTGIAIAYNSCVEL